MNTTHQNTNPENTKPDTTALHWPLILGLGALALVRPLSSITGLAEVLGRPATQITLTVLITLVWVGVVGASKVARPVVTLVVVGLTYAVLAALLSAIVSPVLLGELRGPVVNPIALVATLVTNALWGFVAGVLALMVQRTRGAGGPVTPRR